MNENTKIRELIMKPYLSQMGASPDAISNFPEVSKVWDTQVNLRGRMKGVLTLQGWEPGKPWLYKDSRILLTYPAFYRNFPDAVWVVVRRAENQIGNSCQMTAYMRTLIESGYITQPGGDRIGEAIKTMISAYLARINNLRAFEKVKIHEIWPERMLVSGDFTEIKQIVQDCGLHWNALAINDYIMPKDYLL